MTLLFIICATIVVFFLVFLVACSRPSERRTTRYKGVSVHKISSPPETQFADALCGRRFLAHLEQQMAEFVMTHHRSVALRQVSPEGGGLHRNDVE